MNTGPRLEEPQAEGSSMSRDGDSQRNPTSGTGVPLLDATTATGDHSGSTLSGRRGLDLVYGNPNNETTDRDPNTKTFIDL
jgi:hypothetical protein